MTDVGTWEIGDDASGDDQFFSKNPGEVNPTLTYVATDEAVEEVGAELASRAWSDGTTVDGRPIRDEIASAVDQWTRSLSQNTGGSETLFFRNRFSMTTNPFDQMLQCADAVEHDEVLSAIADTTEGLAFQRFTLECPDPDQQDIWNQIALELRLQRRVREVWRELFKVSQCYIGIWWSRKTFTVRTSPTGLDEVDQQRVEVPSQRDQIETQLGPVHNDMGPDGLPLQPLRTEGPRQKRKRRKQYSGLVPSSLTIFDPTKVMPVGTLMFGRERFAYLANDAEHRAFEAIFAGKTSDDTVFRMLEGPYSPSLDEASLLNKTNKNVKSLWLFRPEALVRIALTRASYERFSPVRLKSVIPLLDMKSHLRAADRATLIGATNFIIVLKRGSDKLPAKGGEIDQLREQARVVARMPILIGDHRLSVEIVTPNTDNTLNAERYDTLDERIVQRALGTFKSGPGNESGRSGGGNTMAATVIRNVESRRNQIAEDLETELFKLVVDRNKHEKFLDELPNVSFLPRRVTLGTDSNLVNAILQLRDRGDISRETMLEELDYDQNTEFLRRKREKPMDEIFKSSVPFSSPGTNPFSNGAQGGRPPGSGPNGVQAGPGGAQGAPGGKGANE